MNARKEAYGCMSLRRRFRRRFGRIVLPERKICKFTHTGFTHMN